MDHNLVMADISVTSSSTYTAIVVKEEQSKATEPIENSIEVCVLPVAKQQTSEPTANNDTYKCVSIEIHDAYNDIENEYHLLDGSPAMAPSDTICDDALEKLSELRQFTNKNVMPDDSCCDDDSYSIVTRHSNDYDTIEMLDNEFAVDDDYESEDNQSTADPKIMDACNTYYCSGCDVSIPLAKQDDHRQMHGELMANLMESIDYFRCGNCCTVFISVTAFSNHIETSQCYSADTKDAAAGAAAAGDCQLLNEATFYKISGENVMPKRLHSIRKLYECLYECDLCRLILNGNTVGDIQRHYRSHYHLTSRTTVDASNQLMEANVAHRCGDCDKLLPNIVETFYHAYFHLSAFACPLAECQLHYQSFRLLDNHLRRSKHGQVARLQRTVTGKLLCNLCGMCVAKQRERALCSLCV